MVTTSRLTDGDPATYWKAIRILPQIHREIERHFTPPSGSSSISARRNPSMLAQRWAILTPQNSACSNWLGSDDASNTLSGQWMNFSSMIFANSKGGSAGLAAREFPSAPDSFVSDDPNPPQTPATLIGLPPTRNFSATRPMKFPPAIFPGDRTQFHIASGQTLRRESQRHPGFLHRSWHSESVCEPAFESKPAFDLSFQRLQPIICPAMIRFFHGLRQLPKTLPPNWRNLPAAWNWPSVLRAIFDIENRIPRLRIYAVRRHCLREVAKP